MSHSWSINGKVYTIRLVDLIAQAKRDIANGHPEHKINGKVAAVLKQDWYGGVCYQFVPIPPCSIVACTFTTTSRQCPPDGPVNHGMGNGRNPQHLDQGAIPNTTLHAAPPLAGPQLVCSSDATSCNLSHPLMYLLTDTHSM